jgi:hypothetical protein
MIPISIRVFSRLERSSEYQGWRSGWALTCSALSHWGRERRRQFETVGGRTRGSPRVGHQPVDMGRGHAGEIGLSSPLANDMLAEDDNARCPDMANHRTLPTTAVISVPAFWISRTMNKKTDPT